MRFDYIPLTSERRPTNRGWQTTIYTQDDLDAAPCIGVRTGTAHDSGYLVVVDIDVKKGDGERTWAEHVDGRDLPDTYQVRTRSGGRHLYYRTTEPVGCPHPGFSHVDIRGAGGLVVCPPTPNYSLLCDTAVAWAPVWLETWLLGLSQSTSRGRRSDEDLAADEPVDLTPELVREFAGHYPGQLADMLESLLQRRPVAGPGQRHQILRLGLIPQILGAFGPGVTLESLAELFAGDYPRGRFPDEDLPQLADALRTARRKCDPEEAAALVRGRAFSEAVTAWATERHRVQVLAPTEQTHDSLWVAESLARAGRTESIDLAYHLLAQGEYVWSEGTYWRWDEYQWVDNQTAPHLALEGVLDAMGVRKQADRARGKRDTILKDFQTICEQHNIRMDVHRHLIGFRNGVWDTRSRTLRPARQEDYISRASPYRYIPGATHPAWSDMLRTFSTGDETWERAFQFYSGAALRAQRLELFPIMCGSGANGKSSLIQTFRMVMGARMCSAMQASMFAGGGGAGGHTSQIGRCDGARLVIATELPPGRLDWPLIKRMLGDTEISVQKRMGGDFQSITPTWTTMCDMNGRPVSDASGRAERRRLRIIPFDREFTPAEMQAGKHKEAWEDSAFVEAVLAWLMEGSMIEREPECERISAATDAVFEDEALVEWLEERFIRAPEGRLSRKDLRTAFERATFSQPARHISEMYRIMDARFRAYKGHDGIRGWVGWQLKEAGKHPFN